MLDKIYAAKDQIQRSCSKLGKTINVMEVCGTHTVSIFRNGIRQILPANLKLLSGPGCPVCVTDQGYIDSVLELAGRDDCIIATYGDMIRVPGKAGSLETMQSKGNVRVVLSSDDALKIAQENPDTQVVFIAVGFETTTPATAVAIMQAKSLKINNFSVLCAHKLVLPAMKALVSEKNDKIDAFLCPGHVSAITGYGIFSQIVQDFKRPCVVCGFEPLQIMQGLAEICTQLAEGEPQLKSVYSAVVSEQGNTKAKQIIDQCFEPADGYWRGLGMIPQSSLKVRDKYAQYDAFRKFKINQKPGTDLSGCRCGEVLCGLIDPDQCELFGTDCTPTTPIGPCMVSSEGACSAWYKFGKRG